jgi:hypothetical protein
MSATTLRDRLARLGVTGPALESFTAWCRRVGYLDPLERYSDRDLAARVLEWVDSPRGLEAARATLGRQRRDGGAW